MKAVVTSAEHHFLTNLEKLKPEKENWIFLTLTFGKAPAEFCALAGQPAQLQGQLAAHDRQGRLALDALMHMAPGAGHGFVYLFADGDVAVLAQDTPEARAAFFAPRLEALQTLPARANLQGGMLEDQFYRLRQTAEKKLLHARCLQACRLMTDTHQTGSIDLRRRRRDHRVVLVIEDDPFTASHASFILSRRYGVVLARSGEEGIEAYIQHAPDMVFLDVHLPGLSGHETLQTLKSIDPRAYVVMASADSARDLILRAQKEGARNFLKKPFTRDNMIGMAQKCPWIRFGGAALSPLPV